MGEYLSWRCLAKILISDLVSARLLKIEFYRVGEMICQIK